MKLRPSIPVGPPKDPSNPKQTVPLIRLPPEGAPLPGDHRAEFLIREKHDEYAESARTNRKMYYTLRLVAGLSAALLPYFVATMPWVATALSVLIVIATVFDMIFNPKDRWQLFSRAADLLAVERLKRTGEYKDYEAALSVLIATESAKLERLVSIDDVLKKVHETKTPAA